MSKEPANIVLAVGGLNGAGKSTLIAAIANVLNEHGIDSTILVSRIDDRKQIATLREDAPFLQHNLKQIADRAVVEIVELNSPEVTTVLNVLHMTEDFTDPRSVREVSSYRGRPVARPAE